MNDSTPHLDRQGIYRDRPILPFRHPIDEQGFTYLAAIADLGALGSVQRQGWINLLLVHGFPRVMRAAAWCFRAAGDNGLVTNEQAQLVLDGKDADALEQEVRYRLNADRRRQVA
jgi:hypothetical protein